MTIAVRAAKQLIGNGNIQILACVLTKFNSQATDCNLSGAEKKISK